MEEHTMYTTILDRPFPGTKEPKAPAPPASQKPIEKSIFDARKEIEALKKATEEKVKPTRPQYA